MSVKENSEDCSGPAAKEKNHGFPVNRNCYKAEIGNSGFNFLLRQEEIVMYHKLKYCLLIPMLLFSVCVPVQVQAAEMTVSGPEMPALVISGSDISRGRGFLHNYVAVTSSEIEDMAASASGEATYRLGLGDCFTEAVTYSTYEDHGTPTWIYRRVCGLDLKIMAEALGIDTTQAMSISVRADDGMSKTLTDAFGVNNSRWTYDFTGTKVDTVSPVLALYQTTVETEEPSEQAVMPILPVLGQDSPDRADNVFGYGQTDFQEITSCYWVKNVRRLRFGTEEPALTVHDVSGASVTVSLSTLISRGIWQAGIGTVKAQGVPVTRLLDDSGIDLPDGFSLQAESTDSHVILSADQLEDAFIAWQASEEGSAVRNTTALRLYYGEGQVLPDLVSLSVAPADEPDASSGKDTDFTDLDNYGWAKDAVLNLSQRGVVRGISSTCFGPDLNIRRGDFMLMLARAYNLAAEADGNFQDVPAGSYYYDAIAAARTLGIAQGDGSFFKPDSSITRQEAMALIYRTLKITGHGISSGSTDLSGFTDAGQVAGWAEESVRALTGAGIIQGSDNQLNPLDSLTRAEMAVILSRTLELK